MRYHKKKWALQIKARTDCHKRRKFENVGTQNDTLNIRVGPTKGLGGFLRKKARTMYDSIWQVVRVSVLFC